MFRLTVLLALTAWAHAAAVQEEQLIMNSHGDMKKVMRRETKRHLTLASRDHSSGDGDGTTGDDTTAAKASCSTYQTTTLDDGTTLTCPADKPVVQTDASCEDSTCAQTDESLCCAAAAATGALCSTYESTTLADGTTLACATSVVTDATARCAAAQCAQTDEATCCAAATAAPTVTTEDNTADAHKTHLSSRTDLSHDFVTEKVSAGCDSHYEYKGLLSNEQCAQKCYETYGCHRFSAGGCTLGCRITVAGKNNPNNLDVPADGQCTTSDTGDASGCIVYKLSFFQATHEPAACSAHYELLSDATNKAQCAHACKNTADCTSFTAEPNCMEGCRISKCDSNGGDDACGADKQCTTVETHGCTAYKVFR